ncbi:hypothetical protein ACT3R7_20115 [Halomonas sp. AOP43-A1-21]|uniref:hypothetical protein n=1 Tax=Halomonas colorata TaxID=2742615 RepID=UPI001865C6BD|nr:hypothetical protein [Halomonas colorata]
MSEEQPLRKALKQRLEFRTILSIVSVTAAVAAATIAVWQTLEAKSASRDAAKYALASERLGSCMKMNELVASASYDASWYEFATKPYRENQRFLRVVVAVHNLEEEVGQFRQMTPGMGAEELWDMTMVMEAHLKDMVADGGDYLTKSQIREELSKIKSAQENICSRMLGPDGGF